MGKIIEILLLCICVEIVLLFILMVLWFILAAKDNIFKLICFIGDIREKHKER